MKIDVVSSYSMSLPGLPVPAMLKNAVLSLTREACCRVNAFDRAYCAQTVECYEPDRRALPTRRCCSSPAAAAWHRCWR